MARIILNSRGINTISGASIIQNALGDGDRSLKRILIVNYPAYGVDEYIIKNCCDILGFSEENVILSSNSLPSDCPDYIYVTEGNAFDILQYMRSKGLIEYIRNAVEKGAIYIGSSAGAMIAGDDIKLAIDFDKNKIAMKDFTALGLFAGTIIPHYEPEELARYIYNSDKKIISGYANIYSVGEESVLIITED